MPLRRKLDILLGAPLVAVLVLLVPVTWNEFSAAQQWQNAAESMRVDAQISVLINDLETEQAVALGLQGLGAVAHPAALDSPQQLKAAAATTDGEIAKLRAALHPATSSVLGQALAEVVWETQGPNGARAAAAPGTPLNGYNVENGYGAAVQELYNALDLDALAGNGGPAAFDEAEFDFLYTSDLSEHGREIDLLALTDNADIDQQSGAHLTIDSTDLAMLERDDGIAESEANRFTAVAPGLDQDSYQAAADSADQAFVTAEQKSVELALADTDPATAVDQVVLNDQALPPGQAGGGDLGLVEAAVHASQERGSMEQEVSRNLIASAQHQAAVGRSYALGLLAGALLLLFLLIVLEIRVRRSVVQPMIRLTRAARQVADVTRADLERVADDDEGLDSQAVPAFETVPITTRDEVGALGEAFNRVQDTAVRVLERQMAVRRNTAEMFGNVGRRIHNLTGRQLSLIDAAEREETDPSVLERLYRIDHLAVRLQRGADSLMLLSGEPEPAFGETPLRLTDVVRSAVGRVEGYQRVVLSAEGDVTVTPAAVGDLTLIVAELVENAVSFSPATSSVDIAVRPTAAGAAVEIVDHGVGMTPARLAEENARLVRRERLDLAPTKVLGLFVVGRLARRSGIAVRLTATLGGGVTVRLDIGADLLFDAPAPPQRRRGPAHAARTASPGAPALPEQRVTRERPGQAPPAAAPPARPDDLPLRRRAKAAPENPGGRPAADPPAAPADGISPLPRRTTGAADAGAATTTASPEPGTVIPTASTAPAADFASPDLARRIRAAVDGVEAPPAPEMPAPIPQRRRPGDAVAALPDPDTPEQATADEGPGALPRRSRSRSALREPALPAPAPLADAHLLDAEAARAAVEEFEAGVEEALRVSAQNLPTLRASDEPEGIRP